MKNWIDTWMEPEGIIGYHWIPEGIQMFFFVQDGQHDKYRDTFEILFSVQEQNMERNTHNPYTLFSVELHSPLPCHTEK